MTTTDPENNEKISPKLVARRNALARQLRDCGCSIVRLHFSGGGDSGQMDEIETVPEVELGSKLELELSFFGEAYLEESGINWFDGEGGGAILDFSLENSTFSSDVWWNEVVRETGFEEEAAPLDLAAEAAAA